MANFTEFVKAFSQFGAEMVELAHLTGNRQNDMKDERRRAQMAAARQVLERSTMLLLTSSKVSHALLHGPNVMFCTDVLNKKIPIYYSWTIQISIFVHKLS